MWLQVFLAVVLVNAGWFLHLGTLRDMISGPTTSTAQEVEIGPDVLLHFSGCWKRNWIRPKEPLIDSVGNLQWVFKPQGLNEVRESPPVCDAFQATGWNSQPFFLDSFSSQREPPVLGSEGGFQNLLKICWISVTAEHQGFV